MIYDVRIRLSKQEDGLYRAECPDLQGCFVDSPSLEEAVADIQDAIRVWLASQKAMGWALPKRIRTCEGFPLDIHLPVEAA